MVLNVRWYLSYRNLVAMMGQRGIDLAHTTILRWGQWLGGMLNYYYRAAA